MNILYLLPFNKRHNKILFTHILFKIKLYLLYERNIDKNHVIKL